MTSPSFEQIEPPPAPSLSKLQLPLYHKTAMIASGQASPRSSDPSGAGRGNPPSLGLYCTTTETQGWLPNAAGPGGARDKDGTRSPANYCCVALGRSTPSTFFSGETEYPKHSQPPPRAPAAGPGAARHGTRGALAWSLARPWTRRGKQPTANKWYRWRSLDGWPRFLTAQLQWCRDDEGRRRARSDRALSFAAT